MNSEKVKYVALNRQYVMRSKLASSPKIRAVNLGFSFTTSDVGVGDAECNACGDRLPVGNGLTTAVVEARSLRA